MVVVNIIAILFTANVVLDLLAVIFLATVNSGSLLRATNKMNIVSFYLGEKQVLFFCVNSISKITG